jgi:hypothetical protein
MVKTHRNVSGTSQVSSDCENKTDTWKADRDSHSGTGLSWVVIVGPVARKIHVLFVNRETLAHTTIGQ